MAIISNYNEYTGIHRKKNGNETNDKNEKYTTIFYMMELRTTIIKATAFLVIFTRSNTHILVPFYNFLHL